MKRNTQSHSIGIVVSVLVMIAFLSSYRDTIAQQQQLDQSIVSAREAEKKAKDRSFKQQMQIARKNLEKARKQVKRGMIEASELDIADVARTLSLVSSSIEGSSEGEEFRKAVQQALDSLRKAKLAVEEIRFRDAESKDTIYAYEEFLQKHPHSPLAEMATAKREELMRRRLTQIPESARTVVFQHPIYTTRRVAVNALHVAGFTKIDILGPRNYDGVTHLGVGGWKPPALTVLDVGRGPEMFQVSRPSDACHMWIRSSEEDTTTRVSFDDNGGCNEVYAEMKKIVLGEPIKKAVEGQDVGDSLELVYRLAEVNEEMGHTQEALANYEEALSAMLNPDGSVTGDNQRNAGIVLRRIALVYRRVGDSAKEKQAIERMRKVLGLKDTLPDMVTLDGLQEDGKFKEAVQVARDAAKKFPDEKAFKYYEAQALGELGKPSDGVAMLRPLLNGTKEDSRVYQFMAVVQMSGNDLDGAGKSIKEAIKLDKEDSDLQITLSSWQDRVKQYKESEETLRNVLNVDPNNATALSNLGYFLTERNERLDEALDLIKRAVLLDPSNGSFLDSLGWLYFKLGKVDDARKYIEQAISYQPRSAAIRDHLGDIYKKVGRDADAVAQWKKALALGHDPDELSNIKAKLESASAKND